MLPLEGIRVLDLSQAAAGPSAGQWLADMGADVIKVEPLTGDHLRQIFNNAWVIAVNRNKRGMAVDLRTPDGKEILLKLMKKSDVFLESFVPGVMDSMGLGFEDVIRINPRIVYCSISGYGQSGPYSKRGGYDACAQAESGVMWATGEVGGPPIRTGTAFMDYSAGMCAALGVAFALLKRERTGRGEHIDISLLDVSLTHMSHWVTWYSLSGQNPPRSMGELDQLAPYHIFETKDKPTFIAVIKDKHWRDLCDALGLDGLADDPRFNTSTRRGQNRQVLIPLLQVELLKYTSDEIQKRLADAGIPCAPVNRISEVTEDPHIRERLTIFEKEYPGLGQLKYVNNPIRIGGSKMEMRRNAPFVGEHTVEILEEIGYPKDQIDRLLERKVIASAEGMS